MGESGRTQEKVCERRAATNSVMAHHEHLGVGFAHCLPVEAQRTPVEPSWTRLHIIPQREPQILELTDFLAVLAVPQVDNVGDTEGLELFHVAPRCNGAAKGQPLANPKRLHTRPLCMGLTRLQNM